MTSHPDEQKDAAEIRDAGMPQKVKHVLLASTALCLVFLLWYIWADRVTPYSNNAIVNGFVIPIVPEVSGTVSKIAVDRNDIVKAGEILIEIDPERYELAVEKAEIELSRAGRDIGTDTATVSTAQAALLDARAVRDNVNKELQRTAQLFRKKVVSQAEYDTAQTAMAQAEAALSKAEAELQKAQTHLGDEGKENIKIRAALNSLEIAKVDLRDTIIRAPSDGGITNLQIGTGHYARAGSPLMTFISSDAVWIEARLRENNLGRMKAGDRADIVLDIAPGRVFKGEVISIGFGVSNNIDLTPGELPTLRKSGGWLREPQLFPVLLKFSDDEAYGLRRVGGLATVLIYSDSNILLSAIGKMRIRLASLFSYFY